jgi:hypothetical protein
LANSIAPSQTGLIPGEANFTLARNNRLFVSTQRRGTVEIWDVANASSPSLLGKVNLRDESRKLGEIGSEANTIAARVSLSENGRFLFTSEQVNGTSVKSFDVSDPANPVFLDTYFGPNISIASNQFLSGNYLYVTYYPNGLWVLDVSNPAEMREVAKYEFGGWAPDISGGVYAAFPSGKIILGGWKTLYILRLDFSTPIEPKPKTQAGGFPAAGIYGDALRFVLPGSGTYSLSLLTLQGREVFAFQGHGRGLQTLALESGASGGGYVLRLRQNAREFGGRVVMHPR